ncbi:unnamed protein product [Darwinula stevensoni]|uniref:Uncharacterized protein n=1 Tax=Darwinula stevensoni TaxID=69355 RepID=A0A7R9ACP3_9CRUS|nr:unnamed protein product [Darwinula stevensoni]CAG0900031.1 unnamed protein product [Darwinula stevensoni]
MRQNEEEEECVVEEAHHRHRGGDHERRGIPGDTVEGKPQTGRPGQKYIQEMCQICAKRFSAKRYEEVKKGGEGGKKKEEHLIRDRQLHPSPSFIPILCPTNNRRLYLPGSDDLTRTNVFRGGGELIPDGGTHLIQCGSALDFEETYPDVVCPMNRAARIGDENAIKRLMNSGGRVDQQDNQGWQPLHEAAAAGNINCVHLLLLKGADVNWQTHEGETPLFLACQAQKNSVKMVSLLLEHGASVNQGNNEESTPLHAAAQACNKECLKTLLECPSIDVDRMNIHRDTPLHSLLEDVSNSHSHVEICTCAEILIDHGASIRAQNDRQMTPFFCAALTGNLPVLRLLHERGIRDSCDIDCRAQYEATPLMMACQHEHTECVEFLLSIDANVNLTDSDDIFPLFYCINPRPQCNKIFQMILEGTKQEFLTRGLIRLEPGKDPSQMEEEAPIFCRYTCIMLDIIDNHRSDLLEIFLDAFPVHLKNIVYDQRQFQVSDIGEFGHPFPGSSDNLISPLGHFCSELMVFVDYCGVEQTKLCIEKFVALDAFLYGHWEGVEGTVSLLCQKLYEMERYSCKDETKPLVIELMKEIFSREGVGPIIYFPMIPWALKSLFEIGIAEIINSHSTDHPIPFKEIVTLPVHASVITTECKNVILSYIFHFPSNMFRNPSLHPTSFEGMRNMPWSLKHSSRMAVRLLLAEVHGVPQFQQCMEKLSLPQSICNFILFL